MVSTDDQAPRDHWVHQVRWDLRDTVGPEGRVTQVCLAVLVSLDCLVRRVNRVFQVIFLNSLVNIRCKINEMQ